MHGHSQSSEIKNLRLKKYLCMTVALAYGDYNFHTASIFMSACITGIIQQNIYQIKNTHKVKSHQLNLSVTIVFSLSQFYNSMGLVSFSDSQISLIGLKILALKKLNYCGQVKVFHLKLKFQSDKDISVSKYLHPSAGPWLLDEEMRVFLFHYTLV